MKTLILQITSKSKEIFAIHTNGDIVLRGEVIGSDEEVADRLKESVEQIKEDAWKYRELSK